MNKALSLISHWTFNRMKWIFFSLKYSLKIVKARTNYSSMRKYPDTIQFPITYLCNFNCIMCGMQSLSGKKEITHSELDNILSDKLFCKVKSVGINGGEPFLKRDLIDYIDIITKRLPKINRIFIITNGFYTKKIIDSLEIIKRICSKKKVLLYVSISIDGIGKMQDFHRGHKDAFDNAQKTIYQILENPKRYTDYLDVICTITRHNIYEIDKVEEWGRRIGITVEYNIATENKRINNYSKVNDFSLVDDEEARLLAIEFFYTQYKKTGNDKYYGLYLYLKTGKRFAPCPCMNNSWVTLTPDGQIGYCATRSKIIGPVEGQTFYDSFNNNIRYLEMIKKRYCMNCSHYLYTLNEEGIKHALKEKLNQYKY